MNTNNKKFHIMDMDGTILDSMPVWINIDDTYLISKGVTPPDNIARIVEKKTMMECCVYFQELGVNTAVTRPPLRENAVSRALHQPRGGGLVAGGSPPLRSAGKPREPEQGMARARFGETGSLRPLQPAGTRPIRGAPASP